MVFPAWPEFQPGVPPIKSWAQWLNPFDPTWQLAWLNYSFIIAEGSPEMVLEPMFVGVWITAGSSGSIWDALNVSTQPNLGTAQEPSRNYGFPLRWGLSRGIKMKHAGGFPPIPPP